MSKKTKKTLSKKAAVKSCNCTCTCRSFYSKIKLVLNTVVNKIKSVL